MNDETRQSFGSLVLGMLSQLEAATDGGVPKGELMFRLSEEAYATYVLGTIDWVDTHPSDHPNGWDSEAIAGFHGVPIVESVGLAHRSVIQRAVPLKGGV